MVVLVTGANGQLGQSLRHIAPHYPDIEFVFCDSLQLNITQRAQIESVFNQYQPEFCINVWSMQGTSQTAQSNAVDIAAGDDDARHLDDQASRRLRERYMCRSMPMHAMFAISDVPPALKNGSGIPMTGKSPTAMPMFTIV